MDRILSGIETEYGLLVEGRGAEEQVDDATRFVRSYPGHHFAGWDYRQESPRADLRGFAVSRLQFDPIDAQFDVGRKRGHDHEIRSDRILPNGARFYNDHGHPEYSTPECWSNRELAIQDKAGELVLWQTARAFEDGTGTPVKVYKNNTDFHGASYGTHEGYLAPRSLGFEGLYKAVLPMLVARQVLCGAGKVGSETGRSCVYQISQRADFFVEPYNTETLFRRPIFNTRDEPHADPREWIRLHVICGDANMIGSATERKVGLVKLALTLAMADEAPVWNLKNPVEAFQLISRDEGYRFEVELDGRSWTTAYEILESYFSAAERIFGLRAGMDEGTPEAEAWHIISEGRDLLESLTECPQRFAKSVDWAAKKQMLEHFIQEEQTDWADPSLRAFDLEYHNINPEEGLCFALKDMGEIDSDPSDQELRTALMENREGTRARARGAAVLNFNDQIVTASWSSLALRHDGNDVQLYLPPEAEYPRQLQDVQHVGTFIECIQSLKS